MISQIKAAVDTEGGLADVTLYLKEDHPSASATVSLPDGRTVDVEDVAIGLPHVKASVRLPFYEAVSKAQGDD